jgi:hypothetical protein
LNRHIDETILDQLALQLRGERKIDVPRSVSKLTYFMRNPEDRVKYEVQTVEDMEEQDFDVSQGQINAIKADIEFKIDRVEGELLREAALQYAYKEALRNGTLTITDDEFKREYELNKNRLFFYERVGFIGVRFIAGFPQSPDEVENAKERLDGGMSFEELINLYGGINEDMIVTSQIYNDPRLPRFQSFWNKVSGAEVGEVIGPLYMPEYTYQEQKPDGTIESVKQPAAHMIIQVTEHEPARQKSWEDAKVDLAPLILRRKMMQRLREEHGVEVYEDKLPDPGRYDSGGKSMFIDVN